MCFSFELVVFVLFHDFCGKLPGAGKSITSDSATYFPFHFLFFYLFLYRLLVSLDYMHAQIARVPVCRKLGVLYESIYSESENQLQNPNHYIMIGVFLRSVVIF